MPEVRIRAPPNASPRAQAVWKQSPWERAREFLFFDEKTAAKYVVTLVESGTVEELRRGIELGIDPVPIIIDRGELDNTMVARLASVFLRSKWDYLSPILGDPKRVLRLVNERDRDKGAVLSTPEGYLWLCWTLYRCKTFLGWFAGIKHMERVQPPPGNCPLKLTTPMLEFERKS